MKLYFITLPAGSHPRNKIYLHGVRGSTRFAEILCICKCLPSVFIANFQHYFLAAPSSFNVNDFSSFLLNMYQGLGGRGEGRGSVVGGGGQLIKLYITSSTVFIFCTVRPIKLWKRITTFQL